MYSIRSLFKNNSSEGPLFGEGVLHVSDRTPEEIIDHLPTIDSTESFLGIDNLPQGAVMVNLGSGQYDLFFEWVKERRPDVTPVGIDLSAGVNPEDLKSGNIGIEQYERLRMVIYTDRTKERGKGLFIMGVTSIATDPEIYQLDRQRHLSKYNVISARSPEIPLRPNSVDLLVDSYGLTSYTDGKIKRTLLKNVVKVLADGGKAIVYPVKNKPIFPTSENENSSVDEVSKLVRAVLGCDKDVSVELFLTYQEKERFGYYIGLVVRKYSNDSNKRRLNRASIFISGLEDSEKDLAISSLSQKYKGLKKYGLQIL